MPPVRHVLSDDAPLCNCSGFASVANSRDTCQRCERVVDDLIYALRQVAERHAADWSIFDSRTKRTLAKVFEGGHLEPAEIFNARVQETK